MKQYALRMLVVLTAGVLWSCGNMLLTNTRAAARARTAQFSLPNGQACVQQNNWYSTGSTPYDDDNCVPQNHRGSACLYAQNIFSTCAHGGPTDNCITGPSVITTNNWVIYTCVCPAAAAVGNDVAAGVGWATWIRIGVPATVTGTIPYGCI